MSEAFHDAAVTARDPAAAAARTTPWQAMSVRVGRWLAMLRQGPQPTLADVDEHMLRDIGLTRMDTWHDWQPPAAGGATGPDGPSRAAPRPTASVDVTV